MNICTLTRAVRAFIRIQEVCWHGKTQEVWALGEDRQIGDHGVLLGVKLFDPEGNEIEVFY